MRGFAGVFRYFAAGVKAYPGTGVFLAVGWVVAVLLTFVQGHFVAADRADLGAFFAYVPWVMAVLASALCMPVATETQRGVSERLATLPVGDVALVVARFGVYWLLMGLWLVGFAPLVATLFYLGKPDVGPLVSGFLGAWLLAAPLLAVALLVCSHARSAVGGLLVSLAVSAALLLVGTPAVAAWFGQVPHMEWVASTLYVTLLGAFAPLAVGAVKVSSLLFLAGVALLALAGVGRRVVKRFALVGFVFVVAAMVPALGWMQLDVTADKVFTPATASVAMLRNLGVPVTVTVHVSAKNPDVPVAVREAVHDMTDLLLRLRAEAGGKLVVKRNDTDASMAAAVRALQAGAEEREMPTGTTYFAALEANIGGNKAVMPLIDPARLNVQEYDVMRLVAQAAANRLPRVAVIGEASAAEKALAGRFAFVGVNTAGPVLPENVDVLLVAQDVPLPATMVQAVRDYMAKGGSAVVLAGGYSRAFAPQEMAAGEGRISDLLPEMGVALVSGTVVADPDLATTVVQPKAGAMAYPFWLTLGAANVNAKVPFLAGVNKVLLEDSGALELPTKDGLTAVPLLVSGPRAVGVAVADFETTEPALAGDLVKGVAGKKILAALVRGRFAESSDKDGALVVVANEDWLGADALAQAPENAAVLGDILHGLAGQGVLAGLQGKERVRPLARVDALAAKLQAEQAVKGAEIARKLAGVGPEAQEEAFTLRQQLRDIRAETRRRLNLLEDVLLAVNLVFSPLVLGALLLGLRVWKKRLAD